MTSFSTFDVGGHVFDVHKAPEDGKPHFAAKVVFGNGHISYVTAEGKMFSTMVGSGKWFIGKSWGGRLRLIQAAIALGVIPKKAAAARIVQIEARRRARRERANAAREILTNHERAGLPLNKRQRDRLRRTVLAGR